MAEVIDIEELRRFSTTLRAIQADQRTQLSRMDGLERRVAVIEERLAELEAVNREHRNSFSQLDRKLDVIIAMIGAGHADGSSAPA